MNFGKLVNVEFVKGHLKVTENYLGRGHALLPLTPFRWSCKYCKGIHCHNIHIKDYMERLYVTDLNVLSPVSMIVFSRKVDSISNSLDSRAQFNSSSYFIVKKS